jgi:hypothetical protein
LGKINKYPKNRKSRFKVETPIREFKLLYTEYITNNKTRVEIAKMYKVKETFVKTLLSNYNIRKEGSGKFVPKKQKATDLEITNMYVRDRKTISEIAEEVDSTYWCIQQSLKRSKTPRRKGADMLVNGPSMEGAAHSFETRKKQSMAKAGVSEKNWPGFSRKNVTSSSEWGRWRKEILNRDRNKCMVCAEVENLQAHHILMRALYPQHIFDTNNGIILCKCCHQEVWGKESQTATKFFTIIRNNEIYRWSGLGTLDSTEVVYI